MNYVKKPTDREWEEATRINLSTKEDKRIPGASSDPLQTRILPVPQCDFCADAEPVVVYAATRTTDGRDVPCWRWAACKRCDRAVTNDNWGSLQRYMTSRFKQFFAARMGVEFKGRPVPDSLVMDAVAHSLDSFHQYAIREDDPDKDTLIQLLPGGGKS